jgi:hypothetical protein
LRLRHMSWAVAITLLVAATACSGGSADEDTVTPDPDSTPQATATVANGGVFPTATPRPTPTPTATAIPPNAVAAAGPDRDAARGGLASLNGSGSSDPEGEQLSYRWEQIHGPDVTGGVGFFAGPTPSFAAPDQVSALIFRLTVNDGHGDSAPDTVQVNVFEHSGSPGLFVDGNSGSDDTGDGSRENPYASISHARSRINGPEQDIYVMSLQGDGSYSEQSTLDIPVTTSLYGGYGPGWVRDVENNKTKLSGAAVAIDIGPVNEDAWISGFDITAADTTEEGADVMTIRTFGGSATLFIEDNVLTAGNAGNQVEALQPGTSYVLFLSDVFDAQVLRNVIVAGNGGTGASAARGDDGSPATTSGANGSGATGGAGGKGGTPAANGGKGGNGGTGLIPQDGSAGGGAGGGIGDKVGEGRVGDGGGGFGGSGGDGGTGGGGPGMLNAQGLFLSSSGERGTSGANGEGGGGGGGGAGGVGLDGGGGGGGGGGGQGGAGGVGGHGGGASIGILLFNVGSALIAENDITAGDGGLGGNGGAGGHGGGGAGGPSYSVLVAPGVAPVLRDNTIASGNGGNGGIGGAAGLGGSSGGSGGSTGGSGGCCAFHPETAGAPGSGGDGGWSFPVFDLDPEDGELPGLGGNTVSAGTPGAGSALNGANGSSGETNF